ncbi:hypothetical protein [Flavobacterium sp.]|uniref:hypothetical protein n=1 Tax=Flavobacterium sp. TaxID=239 RepID=UPI00286D7D0A|nr:hypothetical protein [Flavobacterium sp.]
MKLEISVPKIHCKKNNDWLLHKEKVFVAVTVTTGKMVDFADGGKPQTVFSGVTPLLDLDENTIKELPLGSNWVADLGNAEAYALTIGLYEKDRDDAYDKPPEKVAEISKIIVKLIK